MSFIGVVTVTLGHWLSDFAYYIFVSYVVYKHGKYLNPHQRLITIILGIFMIPLGIYFLSQGLQSIF